MKKLFVVSVVFLLIGLASAQTVGGFVYTLQSDHRLPVAGAAITLTTISPRSSVPIVHRTVSNRDGSYAFRFNAPLPSGTYVLNAIARGYAQAERVTFTIDPTRPFLGEVRQNILMRSTRVIRDRSSND